MAKTNHFELRASLSEFFKKNSVRNVAYVLMGVNFISVGLQVFLADPDIGYIWQLNILEAVIRVVFSLEIILRIFANGESFFRERSSLFDFFMTVLSYFPYCSVAISLRFLSGAFKPSVDRKW